MNTRANLLLIPALALLAWQGLFALSPEREVMPFSITWDSGFGTNVYVTGNHPDLGNWTPTGAVKLRWTTGNVWSGQVAVQKGTALEYKFISRAGTSSLHCSMGNVSWEAGPNRTTSIPAAVTAPFNGKTVYYHSAWTSASLVTIVGTGVVAYAMERIGDGRFPGESLYRASGVGEEGAWLEFVPNGWKDGTNYWDNPPYPGFNNNFYTRLDHFLLQDDNIYGYWPATTVSPPRIVTNFVGSTQPAITGRLVRILLPRGYDEHAPWKRYPVLYLHDGQNVLTNSRSERSSAGSWEGDLTAIRETAMGRMRECIVACIDNSPLRQAEYMPPGDQYPGQPTGVGDEYLRFVSDNVRPTLDFNYRTLNDPRNTLIGGSSMGGLISLYAAHETNLFGGVLAMSPALTRATNYNTALWSKTKRPVRFYVDTGTNEGNVGPGVGNYWEKPWEVFDILLSIGYAVNEEVVMRPGCGHVHNEPAWRDRLPDAFRFLLDARDEPNLVSLRDEEPTLSATNPAAGITFSTLEHFQHAIERASDQALVSGFWTPTGESIVETNPWSSRVTTNVTGPATSSVLRVLRQPVF